MDESIRIIIADDHQLFIEGLSLLLQDISTLRVIDVVYDGRSLLESVHRNPPDLVLLDINMPGMSGLEVAGLICNRFSSVRIIILSTYAESHLINQAKQVGVHGYLLKNSSKEELLDTIKQIFTGVRVFPDSISDNTYGVESGDSFQKKFNLTRRELEIVRLLKENNSNKEIAEKLFLSVFTVETHRKNIMKKLNLHKPAALMKFIYENNL